MNTYLLLRDNKQTGPYTAQQLAEKGLKPYDLVWHEGRSAAWRYPSELEELKAFAPVVEEQPYDRFYKKPGEQAQQSSTVQTQTAQQQVAATSTVQETQPVSKQAEQTAAKHIYVTMPGGKTAASNTNTQVAKKEEARPVVQNDKNAYSTTAQHTEKKAAASSYIISEEDDELNSGMLKGYQSRKKEDDEINNSYLSDYESRKAAFSKNKTGDSAIKQQAEKPVAAVKEETWSTPARRKKEGIDLKALLAGSGKYLQNNKSLTRGLVAAVLILGGVVIGLVINAGHRQPDTKALESLVKEIREQQNEKASATGPATETGQTNNEPQEAERTKEERFSNDNANNSIEPTPAAPGNNNPSSQQMRHAVIKKDNNVVTPPQPQSRSIAVTVSNTTPQPEEAAPAVLETKEKPINQEVLEKARRNIYEQVHVEASAFKTGLFGGISDLDLTVQNKSLYPLDQVAVEIKYFGPERKLVKTQTIIFNNVPPGKRRTLEVPPTNRGISIDYTVTTINSKALGLAQAGF